MRVVVENDGDPDALRMPIYVDPGQLQVRFDPVIVAVLEKSSACFPAFVLFVVEPEIFSEAIACAGSYLSPRIHCSVRFLDLRVDPRFVMPGRCRSRPTFPSKTPQPSTSTSSASVGSIR